MAHGTSPGAVFGRQSASAFFFKIELEPVPIVDLVSVFELLNMLEAVIVARAFGTDARRRDGKRRSKA
jgi:hypothetical protein